MSDDLSGFSLMDLFRSEAETHAATLSTGLLALEGGTPSTSSTIEPMMRAAHSLKGAARIVGLEPAVKVAHAMEDCFVAVQEGRCTLSPAQVDTLLKGVDLLGQIAQLDENRVGAWYLENETVVEHLVAQIQAMPAERPAPAPAVADAPAIVAEAALRPRPVAAGSGPCRRRPSRNARAGARPRPPSPSNAWFA